MEKDALIIRCAGIENGGRIPLQYTGRGENRSPAFEIDHLDKAAITLAVLLEDVSHPIQNFPHWVIWNMPVQSRQRAKPTVTVLRYMRWIAGSR